MPRSDILGSYSLRDGKLTRQEKGKEVENNGTIFVISISVESSSLSLSLSLHFPGVSSFLREVFEKLTYTFTRTRHSRVIILGGKGGLYLLTDYSWYCLLSNIPHHFQLPGAFAGSRRKAKKKGIITENIHVLNLARAANLPIDCTFYIFSLLDRGCLEQPTCLP